MPIGDGCGWRASTRNIAGVGALKNLSNLVTGAVSVPIGALTAAAMYPFSEKAVPAGKFIANYPMLDKDEACYQNCKWNEMESLDGKSCNGFKDGEFYKYNRMQSDRNEGSKKRSSKKHSAKKHSKRSKKHSKRSKKHSSKKHAKRSMKKW